MDEILRLENVGQYNALMGQETLHPLVSVIDFSKTKPMKHVRMNLGFYTLFLKDVKCGDIKYGRNYYDYQEGTLVFIGPDKLLGLTAMESIFNHRAVHCFFIPI